MKISYNKMSFFLWREFEKRERHFFYRNRRIKKANVTRNYDRKFESNKHLLHGHQNTITSLQKRLAQKFHFVRLFSNEAR